MSNFKPPSNSIAVMAKAVKNGAAPNNSSLSNRFKIGPISKPMNIKIGMSGMFFFLKIKSARNPIMAMKPIAKKVPVI